MRKSLLSGLAATLIATAGLVSADGHATQAQLDAAVKARQMHMQLYSFNLGILGAMAKGETPYDAGVASAAADGLAALATLPQDNYWLAGTDSANHPTSRAKPEIWMAGSTAMEKSMAFAEAAVAMQGAAGTDLAALQAAMGAVGGGCGSCHDDYRGPRR